MPNGDLVTVTGLGQTETTGTGANQRIVPIQSYEPGPRDIGDAEERVEITNPETGVVVSYRSTCGPRNSGSFEWCLIAADVARATRDEEASRD